MDELVLDLLDLAKLESKAYKLDLELFCIDELFEDIQNRLQDQINKKEISLISGYSNKMINVYGDYRKIEQVIINILTNAINNTGPKGYIRINIEKEDNLVLMCIENTGVHISPENLSRIWDRFYRVEKSRDRKTGGTGLGLCIVKNILELHESKFDIENTAEGVKFYFTLMSKKMN